MTSVRELKRALDEKGIDYAGVLERPELEKLLQQAEEVEPDAGGQKLIGRRVSIYWDEDDKYYDGTIKEFAQASGEHLVLYDDGEQHFENLADKKLKVKWLAHSTPERRRNRKEPAAAPINGWRRLRKNSDSSAAGPSSAAGNPRKRPRVVEDSDEEAEADSDEEAEAETQQHPRQQSRTNGKKEESDEEEDESEKNDDDADYSDSSDQDDEDDDDESEESDDDDDDEPAAAAGPYFSRAAAAGPSSSRGAGPSSSQDKRLRCMACGEKQSPDNFSSQMKRGLYGSAGILRCLKCTTTGGKDGKAHVRGYEEQAERQRRRGKEAEVETKEQAKESARRERAHDRNRQKARGRKRKAAPAAAAARPQPETINISDSDEEEADDGEAEEEEDKEPRGRQREAQVARSLEERYGKPGGTSSDDDEGEEESEEEGEEEESEEEEDESDDEEDEQAAAAAAPDDEPQSRCYHCNEIGHWVATCPWKDSTRGCPLCGRACQVMISRTEKNPNRKYIKCDKCAYPRGFSWIGASVV